MSFVKVVKNFGDWQKKNTCWKKKQNPYLVHVIAMIVVFKLYTQKIVFNCNAFHLHLNAKVSV